MKRVDRKRILDSMDLTDEKVDKLLDFLKGIEPYRPELQPRQRLIQELVPLLATLRDKGYDARTLGPILAEAKLITKEDEIEAVFRAAADVEREKARTETAKNLPLEQKSLGPVSKTRRRGTAQKTEA